MIEEAFAKVADYHLDHRGHIGMAVGLLAGIMFARSGADASLAGMFISLLFGEDNPAAEQLKMVAQFTGVPSLFLVVAGVATDAVIHGWRKDNRKNAAEKKPDDKGPQPPAP